MQSALDLNVLYCIWLCGPSFGVFIEALYQVDQVPFCPVWWSAFIRKAFWVLLDAFLQLYDAYVVFSFYPCVLIHLFLYVELALHS